MTTYFKFCLLSPLWFPVVVWWFAIILRLVWQDAFSLMPEWFVGLGFVVAFSLVYGALPYLLALYFVWSRIDFERPMSWIKGVCVLPVIFTAIVALGLLLVFRRFPQDWSEFSSIFAFLGLGLGLGYAYVAVWLLGWTLAHTIHKKRNGLENEN